MTTLVDLSPTHPGGSTPRTNSELCRAFELACEHLDGIGPRPFSQPELFRACWSAGAASQLIRAYLALGLIERISEPGARPVYYRVAAHALPPAFAPGPGPKPAGPTHPTPSAPPRPTPTRGTPTPARQQPPLPVGAPAGEPAFHDPMPVPPRPRPQPGARPAVMAWARPHPQPRSLLLSPLRRWRMRTERTGPGRRRDGGRGRPPVRWN